MSLWRSREGEKVDPWMDAWIARQREGGFRRGACNSRERNGEASSAASSAEQKQEQNLKQGLESLLLEDRDLQ